MFIDLWSSFFIRRPFATIDCIIRATICSGTFSGPYQACPICEFDPSEADLLGTDQKCNANSEEDLIRCHLSGPDMAALATPVSLVLLFISSHTYIVRPCRRLDPRTFRMSKWCNLPASTIPLYACNLPYNILKTQYLLLGFIPTNNSIQRTYRNVIRRTDMSLIRRRQLDGKSPVLHVFFFYSFRSLTILGFTDKFQFH